MITIVLDMTVNKFILATGEATIQGWQLFESGVWSKNTVSYYAQIRSYTSILQAGEETYGQCSGCCVAMKTLQESLQYVYIHSYFLMEGIVSRI